MNYIFRLVWNHFLTSGISSISGLGKTHLKFETKGVELFRSLSVEYDFERLGTDWRCL